jgi:hypothetical protein
VEYHDEVTSFSESDEFDTDAYDYASAFLTTGNLETTLASL